MTDTLDPRIERVDAIGWLMAMTGRTEDAEAIRQLVAEVKLNRATSIASKQASPLTLEHDRSINARRDHQLRLLYEGDRMTAPIDPRIEAVAKLLFTGPVWQLHADEWEQAEREKWGARIECLMAAEDVLRGIDEAAEWEYGVRYLEPSSGTPVVLDHPDGLTESDAHELVNIYSRFSPVVLRRVSERISPAGPWEPLP